MTKREKPDFVTDEHLEYLDDLRESGETNMFGAGAYVEREFGMSRNDARAATLYWMDSFGDRQE